jgi:hypothetical protein
VLCYQVSIKPHTIMERLHTLTLVNTLIYILPALVCIVLGWTFSYKNVSVEDFGQGWGAPRG